MSVFRLLLTLASVSTVWGGRLRHPIFVQNQQDKRDSVSSAPRRRDRCPVNAPGQGRRCRRSLDLPSCEYDFVNVPTLNGPTCTGDYTCQATTVCDCLDNAWDCDIVEIEACPVEQANLPAELYEPCEPQVEPVEEEVVEEEPACPLLMPESGVDKCNIPDFTIACPYDYRNFPVYLNDGAGNCSTDTFDCVPMVECECMGGTWACSSKTIARCANEQDLNEEFLGTCEPAS